VPDNGSQGRTKKIEDRNKVTGKIIPFRRWHNCEPLAAAAAADDDDETGMCATTLQN
jgi:hypothetical protein